jgi:photosystem II stability/assembly factor-like uncharacterized protein
MCDPMSGIRAPGLATMPRKEVQYPACVRRRLPRFLFCLASFSAPGAAVAHAPPLASNVLADASGELSVVVTNRGLVFRDAQSRRWQLMCNEALEINSAELANVVLLADDSVLAGTSAGLRRSTDRGCSWQGVGEWGLTSTPALAAHPDERGTVYVATYGAGQGGIRASYDGAASFSLLYAAPDEDYIDSLRVSAADPRWIYATGTTYSTDGPSQFFVLHSEDGGARWQRSALPVQSTDYSAAVLALDPIRPDSVLIGTVTFNPRLSPSRLLLSRDGAQTFSTVFEALSITGAAYDAEGQLWVAGLDGLRRADAELSHFDSVSVASNLGCAMEHAGDLLVCGHYAGVAAGRSGVGISGSGDQVDSFTSYLDFAEVDAPVGCGAESPTAMACARPWLDWDLEILQGVVPAGTTSATPIAPSPPAPRENSGGADPMPGRAEAGGGAVPQAEAARSTCQLGSGTRRGSSSLALLGLGAAGLFRRRSRS